MFWGVIIDNEQVRPFRVADGVKMTTKLYIDFSNKLLEPWHKKKDLSFRKKMIFTHGNASFLAEKVTTKYLERVFTRHGKILQRPVYSPDLKPTENLGRILKRRIFSRERQYTSVKMISGMPF